MDLNKKLAELQKAQRQTEAQINYIAGQINLLEVLIKEQPEVGVEIIKDKKEKT